MLQKIISFLKSDLYLKLICLMCVIYDVVVGIHQMSNCAYQLNPILLTMSLIMQLLAFVYTYKIESILDYLPEVTREGKLIVVSLLIFLSTLSYLTGFAVLHKNGKPSHYGYCVPKDLTPQQLIDFHNEIDKF